MKNLLLISTLFVCFSVSAQTSKSSNARYALNDFRSIRWGAHVDSIFVNDFKYNFIKTDLMRGANAYVLQDDDLTIGTVKLSNIFYIFTETNRFTKVIMKGSKADYGGIRYILEYKFDNAATVKEITNGTEFTWNVDDVKIILTVFHDADLFICEFSTDYNMQEFKKINSMVNDF